MAPIFSRPFVPPKGRAKAREKNYISLYFYLTRFLFRPPNLSASHLHSGTDSYFFLLSRSYPFRYTFLLVRDDVARSPERKAFFFPADGRCDAMH